jgi:RNA polymerase sigma factor (TIGR02999 family)
MQAAQHVLAEDSSKVNCAPRLTEDPTTAEDLLPLVYAELRRLAAARMARQPPGHTLQATALVHEAYLRLRRSGRESWMNRAHFFSAAAEAMRQILVESARRKRALRHGGGRQRVNIEDLPVSIEVDDQKIFEVDEALAQLRVEDPVKAEVVKLRCFMGLNHEEIALVLGVSEKTVKRYWAYAKVWLYQHIQPARKESRIAGKTPCPELEGVPPRWKRLF